MPKVSLNDVWDDVLVSAEGKSKEYELTTPITLTYADGTSATATLSLTPFGEESDKRVCLDMDMDKLYEVEDVPADAPAGYPGDGDTLVDLLPRWTDGWVKQALVDAFGIDPDSQIWEFT